MSVPHISCLRLGKPYRSYNESEVKDYRDGSVKATLSQVNAGIIRRDLREISRAREALNKFSTRELIDISAKAGELFLNESLPLGEDGHMQSAQDYLETSHPQVVCRMLWFSATWTRFITPLPIWN